MGKVATAVIRPPEAAAKAASASLAARQNPAASGPGTQYMNRVGASEITAWSTWRSSMTASRAATS